MRLSARPLLNYASVNSFSYGNQWIIRAGDPNVLYFQIVDLDQGPTSVVGGPNPSFGFSGASTLSGNTGLRYMVGVGSGNQPAGITVTFPSIDDAQVLNSQAIQDPNDKSIWSVSLGQNQKPNSGNVVFAVSEGNSIRRFSVLNLLSVEYPQNDGQA
jgi:hypothetical protein